MYQYLCGKHVDGFPVLIEHRATHGHYALLGFRTRRRDFNDFTFDLQSIAWPRGLGPGDFSAQADHAISEWQAAVERGIGERDIGEKRVASQNRSQRQAPQPAAGIPKKIAAGRHKSMETSGHDGICQMNEYSTGANANNGDEI